MNKTTKVLVDPRSNLAPSDGIPTNHRRWMVEASYCFGVAAVTLIAALIPLMSNPRFYFYDDTQSGAFGIWYEIGEKLRSGEWPLFSDAGWGAGNYAAEGQWGLWNPVIMLIGVLASFTSTTVLFATVLKIWFLCLLAVGTFLLSRDYGANRLWSVSTAVALPLTGFTVYMDGASWVTGLMVFAMLPLTWFGLRRLARGKSPATGLLTGYLLITVGYVHGTLMLVLVIIGILLESWNHRSRDEALRVLAAGLILGLVALAVYLPGVLTAPVTARASVISNSGFLSPDLTGFASSWIGSSMPQVAGWWGAYSPVPMLYIAWSLPLFCLVDFGRARSAIKPLTGVLFLGVLSLALVLAPSDLGPLRFPVRVTPYVSLAILVLMAVLLSKCRVETITRGRVVTMLALVLVGGYLAWGQNPAPRFHALFTGLSVVGLTALVFLLYRRKPWRWEGWSKLPMVLVVGVTLVTAIGQHHYFKAAPLPDFGLPNEVQAYSIPLQSAEGVAFISGNPAILGAGVWDETLLANSWYLNTTRVQNLYSPIMYARYAEDFCLVSHGWTCSDPARKLFTRDETTGKLLVDLLSVDTVQLIREPADQGNSRIRSIDVPEGWHVAETTENTVLWVRDIPKMGTGDIVWHSDGMQVSTVSVESGRVVFRVDSVPASGGRVALSRLDWPGYEVVGASLTEPLRGYLLQLDVQGGSAGEEIVVEFQPPAWPLVVSSVISALVLLITWLTYDVWRRLETRTVKRKRRVR